MKSLFTALVLLTMATTFAQAPQKSFTEKLDGIQTSSKELTKNAGTDQSSVGQSGQMNTSVPLVTVTSRTMSFPLKLSYSSGITVDQQSGPVGLGWALPVGSITRDYGAYEPDYTSTTNEARMLSSHAGGNNGWLEPTTGSSINPYDNGQFLGYNGIDAEGMGTAMSDQYHVSVPGFISNSFWNNGTTGGSPSWALSDFARWKIAAQEKNFVISQEFSRINELNLQVCPGCNQSDQFETSSSFAAAIGILPYVKNGQAFLPSTQSNGWMPTTDEATVKYDDFGQFTITDEKGTVYVFGRPLRGQKFVFSDDPYWSTRASSDAGSNKGSFWKIDFIAEWLLTEIRSVDYQDLNNNGIADDADAGDWIRFEYTAPTKTVETVLQGGGGPNWLTQEVPTYREWSDFSQTDQASSLMHEMAYLQKIVTPLQEIDLTISERYEVDHDYYSKPANKVGNSYYFVDRKYSSSGTIGSEQDFDVRFPVETMKYDTITAISKLIDARLYPSEDRVTGQVVLRYAEKGGEQELAVSNFLIRNNDKLEKLVNGEEIGKPNAGMNIGQYNDGTNKRGKTTLLGVDFYGSDLNEADKTSYAFEYAFNPSYDEVHKRAIVNKYFFPSVRQGYTAATFPEMRPDTPFGYTEIRTNDGTTTTTYTHTGISPYEFLIDFPFHEKYYKLASNTAGEIECWAGSPSLTYSEVTHPLKPVTDQYGYYFAEGCTQCAKAWSLTKMTYPTGGQVSFEYEQGTFSKSIDSPSWSFGENQVPLIREYNDLAKKRSYCQDDYNSYAASQGFYDSWNSQKTLTAAFEVDLPEYVGIRLKSKTVDDRINPAVVTNYAYGTGHMTSLPSSYVAQVVRGFNGFIMRERKRHSWENNYYPVEMAGSLPGFTNDYDQKMAAVATSNIALDGYATTHFYETQDVLSVDGAKSRTYFGSVSGTMTDLYPHYSVFCTRMKAVGLWDGRYVIGGNTLSTSPLVTRKTESYQSGQTTPYQTKTFTYSWNQLLNKPVKFKYNPSLPSYVGYPSVIGSESNQVVLFDNTFEIYLPIWCESSGNCKRPADYDGLDNDDVSGTAPVNHAQNATWTNVAGAVKGRAFIYLPSPNIPGGLALPSLTYSAMQYEKWGSYALRTVKEETNYKGLVSAIEYQYHPTLFYLQQERTSSAYAAETYITTHEYANETYNGITPKFTEVNLLDAASKTTTYLNTVAATNAVNATVVTYDYSSIVPRPNHSYQYETTAVDHATGTFTLPAFDAANAAWRMTQSDLIQYNRVWNAVSTRSDQLYTKVVDGNGLNVTKAVISSPERKFDATYSGFEDLSNPSTIDTWNTGSYLEEQWFTNETVTETVDAKVTVGDLAGPICAVNSSQNTDQGVLYYVVSVNDVSHLAVGQDITFTYTASGTATQVIREIAAITPRSEVFSFVSPLTLDYILCFTVAPLPNTNLTITSPTISYTLPSYRLSGTYSRTGEYSYKLPSIRTTGEAAKKTPVRPVKIDLSLIPTECTVGTPPDNGVVAKSTGLLPESCYWNYQASVWLKYDNDIRSSSPTQEPVTAQSSDAAGDAIYRRGTVNTSTSQGVKVICTVWNAARTQVVDQFTYYPQQLNTAWKQFTVDIPIYKGPQQWIDVYVENDLSQPGATSLNGKSVFVDDIIVCPKDAKYNYSVYDKFGNTTFAVNNDDVFTETIYDAKSRDKSTRNAYGITTAEISYFNHPTNWATQNNHFTERKWIANGLYNETRYYIDGFGKTRQTIVSDNVRNMRMASETNLFNARGIAYRSYKPYFINGSTLGDKYDSYYEGHIAALYGSNFAYTEVATEATPDAKVATSTAPRKNSESAVTSSQSDYVTTTAVTHPYLAVNPTYAAGKLIVHETVNPLGKKTRTYVDNLGRVIMEEHEIGNDHVQNANGSTTILTTGFAYSRTWFVYDGTSRIIATYDPDGKKTEYFYNSLGLVVKSISPDQGTSEMRYDKYGQLRFAKNAKDYEAIQSNTYGCDQFKYTKYDPWGRVTESGVLTVAPNSLGGTGTPPFPTTHFFDDYSAINNEDFPTTTQKFVQVHNELRYEGTRDQYSSNTVIRQTTYSEHALNTSTYLYTAGKTDVTNHAYMADGQLAKTTYTYDGLAGLHDITYIYNDMRIPIGKDYTSSVSSASNFKWRTTIDNFGRPVTMSTTYNGTTTQTGKNYYDPLGNLLMVGVGATGVTANPHLDYQVIQYDIRDQLTSRMSKFFRAGLTYDAAGNITNQYWSNEYFDPATATSTAINQYAYTYDKLNRLIGADYQQSQLTSNPFAYYSAMSGNFPNDFACGVNEREINQFMQPIYAEFDDNINEGNDPERSRQAIESLNQLIGLYVQNNVPYGSMSATDKDQFLKQFMENCSTSKIDASSYEYYQTEKNEDEEHKADLDRNGLTLKTMKYYPLLLVSLPYITDRDCLPNTAATAYGYLPPFVTPAATSNAMKYDAAYWYTNNGNLTQLNRNDDTGVKTTQAYIYANALNNRLTGVTWTPAGSSAFTYSYGYDANGSLVNDARNGVSAINYSVYDDLPTSMTNVSGTYKYRYAGGARSVKDLGTTDREYYIEGIVLDQDAHVKSYQTENGYATPTTTGTADYFYYVKDWLGTNRAVINSSGVILNASDNYPYGKKLPARNYFSTSHEGYRFQFTGHEFDGETGYEYHGARYYNEELAKYMSVDPLAANYMGWSSYAYVLGNPISLTDPTGMAAQDWVHIGNTYLYDSRVHDQGDAVTFYGGTAQFYSDEEGHSYSSYGHQVVLGANRHFTLDGVDKVAKDFAYADGEQQTIAYLHIDEGYGPDKDRRGILEMQFDSYGAIGTRLQNVSMFHEDMDNIYRPEWLKNRKGVQAVNDLIEGMLYETVWTLTGEELAAGAFRGLKWAYKAAKYGRAGEQTAAATEKAIVIGEGMYRIKPVCRELNAKWYQAWSKNFPTDRLMTELELNAAKARNARWLKTKIKQGYKIYDIGIDSKRTLRSPFYELEQNIIEQTGYTVIKI